jgi:hypothetical protein
MSEDFKFDYQINAAMHFNRAAQCLKFFQQHQKPDFLFYASFELRNCIERYLFEQLVLIHMEESKLEMFKNEYRTKRFRQAILDSEPDFFKKIEFMNIFFEAMEVPFKIPEPDFNTLDTFYGRLGNYLHSLKIPSQSTEDENWWKNFHSLLDEIMAYMSTLLSNPQAHFKLNEIGKRNFEAFLSGEKNKAEVIKSIREGK